MVCKMMEYYGSEKLFTDACICMAMHSGMHLAENSITHIKIR